MPAYISKPLRSSACFLLIAIATQHVAAASIDLSLNSVDGTKYGYNFDGVSTDRARLDIRFSASGRTLRFSGSGYDIDSSTEVQVFLNDTAVSYLPSTGNNSTGRFEIEISSSRVVAGTNTLSLVQRRPGWRWGVTDLLLEESQGPSDDTNTLVVGMPNSGTYGYRFRGVSRDRDQAAFEFAGVDQPLSLSLTAYDIDNPTEVGVLVNGSEVGFLSTTPDNGLGQSTLTIPSNVQVTGVNSLVFVQRRAGWKWGVTDLLLEEGSAEPPGIGDGVTRDLTAYELVFSDEFDGAQLDASKWYTGLLWGPYLPINNEQQLYVDTLGMHSDFSHSPFEMTGETLKITATPTSPSLQPPPRPPENSPLYQRKHSRYRYNGPTTDPDTGVTDAGYQPSDVDYLSGIITSYDSFKLTHGYVEARAKLPRGQGLWPAFWLLPTHYVEDVPEIDVMEFLGQDVDRFYNTYHFFDVPAGWQLVSSPSFPVYATDWTRDFHTFGMEWTPRRITYYVDGVVTHSITDQDTHSSGRKYKIPQQAMYLIANLAVGGNWPGDADETTPFPATFELDYIRAYKKKTADPIDLSGDYQIVFRDEFNEGRLDPDKWNSHFLWGPYLPINSEEQYYVDALQSDAELGYSPFSFANGKLSITARAADDPAGVAPPAALPGPNDPIWSAFPTFRRNEGYTPQRFTSGLLTSYDSFKFVHGYAEVRARIPKGDGLWPAFWLLNGYYVGAQPEIDVLEARGRRPDQIEHHYHRYEQGGVLRSEDYVSTRGTPDVGYSDGYHRYGVRWQPGRIDWYIDRVKVHSYVGDDAPYQLMYVILNLAVGGAFDPGVTPDPNDFPASFDIDYVRVYQVKD